MNLEALFFMLKKLTLLFIKISSSIFVLDLFLKLIILYFPINLIWVKIIDIISKIILCIGFIILSFTFKYCGYHRSLFYISFIGYLIYLINLLLTIDITILIYFIIIMIIIIPLTFLIIHLYIKHGKTKTNSWRK